MTARAEPHRGSWRRGYLPHPHGQDLPVVVAQRLARQQPYGWWNRAACASPDVDPRWWYPTHGTDNVAAALAVCAECPVRRACRAWALLVGEPHGIWGGLTANHRHHLRTQLSADMRRCPRCGTRLDRQVTGAWWCEHCHRPGNPVDLVDLVLGVDVQRVAS